MATADGGLGYCPGEKKVEEGPWRDLQDSREVLTARPGCLHAEGPGETQATQHAL